MTDRRLYVLLVDLVRAAQAIEPTEDPAVLDERLRAVDAAVWHARRQINPSV